MVCEIYRLTRFLWKTRGRVSRDGTAMDQSLRPMDFAPAFGRTVAPLRRALYDTAKAVSLSKTVCGKTKQDGSAAQLKARPARRQNGDLKRRWTTWKWKGPPSGGPLHCQEQCLERRLRADKAISGWRCHRSRWRRE